MRRANVGSTIKVVCDRVVPESPPIFRRIYICLKACKDGFLAGCRPFISLDACHLKGPCQGQVMAAVGIDGNNGLYPLAWAVVEAETRDSWMWFLSLLQDDIRSFSARGYTFISDQQKGLVPTFDNVFPNVDHRFCARHLYANFQKQFKGLVLQNLFWNAAKATTVNEFHQFMVRMSATNVNAFQYLNNIPVRYWAKHAFQTQCKCDLFLSNMSESCNAYIRQARDKPIIHLLEIIRKLAMTRITEKSVFYNDMEMNLGFRIAAKLEEIKGLSGVAVSVWVGNLMFEVVVGGDQFVVDLGNRSCSCRAWDLTSIPCIHGVQCIYFMHQRPEEYVHECFHKQILINTYSHFIRPVNGPSLCPQTFAEPLHPPSIRRPPVDQQDNVRKTKLKQVPPNLYVANLHKKLAASVNPLVTMHAHVKGQ